jgi:hypothetical protein
VILLTLASMRWFADQPYLTSCRRFEPSWLPGQRLAKNLGWPRHHT